MTLFNAWLNAKCLIWHSVTDRAVDEGLENGPTTNGEGLYAEFGLELTVGIENSGWTTHTNPLIWWIRASCFLSMNRANGGSAALYIVREGRELRPRVVTQGGDVVGPLFLQVNLIHQWTNGESSQTEDSRCGTDSQKKTERLTRKTRWQGHYMHI